MTNRYSTVKHATAWPRPQTPRDVRCRPTSFSTVPDRQVGTAKPILKGQSNGVAVYKLQFRAERGERLPQAACDLPVFG